MDKQYEEAFVRNFFQKRLQDRVLFELSSRKRRRDALWRLCHNYDVVLNTRYMKAMTQPISTPEQVLQLLHSHGAKKESCYVMSLNEGIDGKHCSLVTALEETVFYGLASIISCVPQRLAYFQAEQVQGPPPRYILLRA